MRLLPLLLVLAVAVPAAAQQATDAPRVYNLPEVDVLPQIRNAADFSRALHHGYPKDLRAAGVTGRVQVGFVVGPNGVPRDIEVLSTTDSRFNEPAVQAVRLMRFTPAQVQGRRVSVRVEQPIAFLTASSAASGPAGGPGGSDEESASALHTTGFPERGLVAPSLRTVAPVRSGPARVKGQLGQV